MPMEKQGTVEVETQLAHAIDQTEFDSRYDETAKKMLANKQVLAQILHHSGVKRDVYNSHASDNGNDEGKNDTGHDRCRDGVLPQGSGMSYNGSSGKNYNCRKSQGTQILKLERCAGAVGSRSVCTKVADNTFHKDILRFLYTCFRSIKYSK